jgi:hypothetical protein
LFHGGLRHTVVAIAQSGMNAIGHAALAAALRAERGLPESFRGINNEE